MSSRAIVARPSGVNPTSVIWSSAQQKCSSHSCIRGLNRATPCPDCSSVPRCRFPLARLHETQATRPIRQLVWAAKRTGNDMFEVKGITTHLLRCMAVFATALGEFHQLFAQGIARFPASSSCHIALLSRRGFLVLRCKKLGIMERHFFAFVRQSPKFLQFGFRECSIIVPVHQPIKPFLLGGRKPSKSLF